MKSRYCSHASSTSSVMPCSREELAVALDHELALVRAPDLGRDRVARARTRRRGCRARGRSPPSRGSRCASPSTKRLPRCGSPCTSVRSPSRYSGDDVARALRDRARRAGGTRRAGGRRSASTAICTNIAPPSPRAGRPSARSTRGRRRARTAAISQYRACSARELLDDVAGAELDVGVVAVSGSGIPPTRDPRAP